MAVVESTRTVAEILERVLDGERLSDADALTLLQSKDLVAIGAARPSGHLATASGPDASEQLRGGRLREKGVVDLEADAAAGDTHERGERLLVERRHVRWHQGHCDLERQTAVVALDVKNQLTPPHDCWRRHRLKIRLGVPR